jgi:hypothetical protein
MPPWREIVLDLMQLLPGWKVGGHPLITVT